LSACRKCHCSSPPLALWLTIANAYRWLACVGGGFAKLFIDDYGFINPISVAVADLLLGPGIRGEPALRFLRWPRRRYGRLPPKGVAFRNATGVARIMR